MHTRRLIILTTRKMTTMTTMTTNKYYHYCSSSYSSLKRIQQRQRQQRLQEKNLERRHSSSSSSSSSSITTNNKEEEEEKKTDTSTTTIAIIGSGAAGLTAAYFAAKTVNEKSSSSSSSSKNHIIKIKVYERTKESGKKILMSGGARCNVLPVEASIDDFVTDSNPRLAKAILQSWTVAKCHKWLQDEIKLELGIEHATNKYFPLSNSSREVRDKLVEACKREGVLFQYETNVTKIMRDEERNIWVIKTENTKDIEANALILSLGGSSFPAVGTDGTGYVIAERDLNNVTVNKTYPALVPLVGEHPGGENTLPGVSLDCQVKIKKAETKKAQQASRSGFLFTHKGYSGPSILDLSHHVVNDSSHSNNNSSSISKLVVNWNPACDWKEVLNPAAAGQSSGGGGGSDLVIKRLKLHLPARLCEALLKEADVDSSSVNVSNLPKAKRIKLIEILSCYEIKSTGHQGFRKAEVTGGGIALESVDTKTMELKNNKNVFVCGEICDIFGRIGGFNFLWAWTSGRLAGINSASV
jgi:predicted Rossmann fold flavoprotein